MSVRKQHNRYRVDPYGTDKADVLRRGKRFFTIGNYHQDFMLMPYKDIWTASSLPAWGKMPRGAIVVTWNGKRWTERES